jgi:glucosyl-dolichyl phosphate glucuronosyltransferase
MLGNSVLRAQKPIFDDREYHSVEECDMPMFSANLPMNTPELCGGDMRNISPSALQTQGWENESVPKVSVIIPTKNRADDLRRTVEDLIVQTRRPDEIIIVDQSSVPSFEPASVPIPVNYIYAPHISGAAVARNLAMDRATGDIWLFLDDDVILEPEYVEQIVLAYSAEVAGVSGIITNYTVPSLSRRLFESVFVRGAFHDDRQPVYWHADALRFQGPQRVKQFGCGVMSFRGSVVRDLRFDPQLTGCSLAEDIDFCARLPRGAILVIAPKARLFHKRSPAGRATAHWLDEHGQSSTYMRLRNWRRGLRDDLSFAWLQIGYAVMATIGSLKRGSLEPFRAWRQGRARGRALGSPSAMSSSYACAKETPA